MRRRGAISCEELGVSRDVQIRRGEPQPDSWLYGGLRRQGRQRSVGPVRSRCGAGSPSSVLGARLPHPRPSGSAGNCGSLSMPKGFALLSFLHFFFKGGRFLQPGGSLNPSPLSTPYHPPLLLFLRGLEGWGGECSGLLSSPFFFAVISRCTFQRRQFSPPSPTTLAELF